MIINQNLKGFCMYNLLIIYTTIQKSQAFFSSLNISTLQIKNKDFQYKSKVKSRTSYKRVSCTVCVNNVLGVNLHHWECLNLFLWKQIKGQKSNAELKKKKKTQKPIYFLLCAIVVSSFPWVNTTILCLFVFTLGKAWAFLAISWMSLVCGQNTVTCLFHRLCGKNEQAARLSPHPKVLLFGKRSRFLRKK